MTTKRIIAQLEKRMKAVAVERDRLRDLEDEVGALRETCSEAYDSLERAIDALSQLV